MASSLASSIAAPSAGVFRPRVGKPSQRAAAVVTRVAADGAGVEASTDGKHKDACMAMLDNCVTSSNLSVGEKYEAGHLPSPHLPIPHHLDILSRALCISSSSARGAAYPPGAAGATTVLTPRMFGASQKSGKMMD